MTGRLNIPNMLTLSRLFLVGLMLFFLESSIPYGKSLALVAFIVSGITDFLDGYLARTRYGVTSFGQLMDPLADKVMICAAFVSLAAIRLPTQSTPLMPAWIVVIIISREFLVTGLRLLAANQGKVIAAGQWGKHKTVWQVFAVVVLLLGLAIRFDLMGGSTAQDLQKFDLALDHIGFAVGIAVTMITAASGAIYFTEHMGLVSRHLGR